MHVDNVQFDSKELWRLSDVAEKRGLTVPGLLASLGKDLLAGVELPKPPPPPPEPEPEPEPQGMSYQDKCAAVEPLRNLCLSDGEIAQRVGMSVSWVFDTRKRLGIPPVAPKKRTTQQRLDAAWAIEQLEKQDEAERIGRENMKESK
jgi:hypothetical protein